MKKACGWFVVFTQVIWPERFKRLKFVVHIISPQLVLKIIEPDPVDYTLNYLNENDEISGGNRVIAIYTDSANGRTLMNTRSEFGFTTISMVLKCTENTSIGIFVAYYDSHFHFPVRILSIKFFP